MNDRSDWAMAHKSPVPRKNLVGFVIVEVAGVRC